MLGVVILSAALLVDLVAGEPPRKLHPTVWIGVFAERLSKTFLGRRFDRLLGVLLAVLVVSLSYTIPAVLLELCAQLTPILHTALAALLLKASFAFRSMEEHVKPVAEALLDGRVEDARVLVSRIVRRRVEGLDESGVCSAAIESVAEGLVDGFTSPLTYYPILGPQGALAYRAVNTLDSTVGYREEPFTRLGWFSAKLDTLANYLPARLTALLTVLASLMLGMRWRDAWRLMVKEHALTQSVNSGWPISAFSGALGVRLEKQGCYVIGGGLRMPRAEDCLRALRLMKLTAALYTLTVSIPLTLTLSWWWV